MTWHCGRVPLELRQAVSHPKALTFVCPFPVCQALFSVSIDVFTLITILKQYCDCIPDFVDGKLRNRMVKKLLKSLT